VSQFQIAKFDDVQSLVFGFANVSISKRTAMGAGGEEFFDLQKDSVPPDELENGAYDFVLHFREADEMHEGDAIGHLVESIVFTPEKLEKFATDPVTGAVDKEGLEVLKRLLPTRWWVGFKLSKSAYAGVKSGKYTMFSIAGDADRVAA
jgi:hypothetical protein